MNSQSVLFVFAIKQSQSMANQGMSTAVLKFWRELLLSVGLNGEMHVVH